VCSEGNSQLVHDAHGRRVQDGYSAVELAGVLAPWGILLLPALGTVLMSLSTIIVASQCAALEASGVRQSKLFVGANTMRDFTGKGVLVTGGATGTCRAILIVPVWASVAMTLSSRSSELVARCRGLYALAGLPLDHLTEALALGHECGRGGARASAGLPRRVRLPAQPAQRPTASGGSRRARVIEQVVAREPLTIRSLIDDTRRCRWFRPAQPA